MRLAQERCSFSDKLKITSIENLGKLVGSLANSARKKKLFIQENFYFRSGVSTELSSIQFGRNLSVLIWLSALLIMFCPVEMVCYRGNVFHNEAPGNCGSRCVAMENSS